MNIISNIILLLVYLRVGQGDSRDNLNFTIYDLNNRSKGGVQNFVLASIGSA